MTWLYVGWGILAVIVLFEVVGRVLNRVGSRICITDIGRIVHLATSRGFDGHRLRFRCPGRKYRIDFLKSIPSTGQTKFQMVLDSRRCSESEFRAAQEALRGKGIEFVIVPDSVGGHKHLIVDCGPDVLRATRAARSVFTEAFGFDLYDTLRASHQGRIDWDRSREPMIGWEEEGQAKSETKGAKSQQQEGGGNGSAAS